MLSSLRSSISSPGAGSANPNNQMRRPYPLCLLISAMFSVPAAAAPNDALQLYGALGYTHDDNLLRVPEGQPAFDNTLGDSWVQAEGGLIFDKTFSRQKLFAQAKLSKVKFNHFKQLDYSGEDLQARWNWQIGNRLEGKAGASYAQTLAPYTDFRSSERNLRQQRRGFVDGAWRFHPRWQVRGGAQRDKFTYEALSQRFNERTEDAVEAGFDYLAPSGSTAGLVARRLKGKYPNRRPIGPIFIDDSYDQDELKARIHWSASGVTTLELLGGWVKRKQASSSERDTSGVNGKLSASYMPRGKLSINAAVWRDFAPLESTLVSYTLNKGASVGAAWDASAKVRVEGTAIYERRDYTARLVPNSRPGLDDAVRSATLRATYTPARALQLSTAYSHQARSGSAFLGIGGFSSNSISVSAIAQF
jgi:exopolysaccharide biosynthesis operon protein EpsL